MKIVLYGNPVLRTKSKEVDKIDNSLKKTLSEMVDTMRDAGGIGLAANQVGLIGRFFVIEIEGELKKIINPEIIESSKETELMEEGCLSIPGIYKKVSRPIQIKVKYLDENENEVVEELDGMWARAFQHELDHLDGVLFIDKISPMAKKMILSKLKKMKKEGE